VIRGQRPSALPSLLLAIAVLAVVLALPGPAVAAPTSRSAVLPAELANGDVLPVSRRKSFFVPNLASNRVLVFAPYTVNDFRGGWTTSKSNTTRWGTAESQTAKAKRSFTFALHGGATPIQAECNEQATAEAMHERGDPAPRVIPDHSLRCTLYAAAGGAFELTVENGRGELVGTGGDQFTVSAILAAASRWEPPTATGLLLRSQPGDPVAAVDFAGKGRVILERCLQSPSRELLAAAAAALLLGDLAR
jgi:hypothetical protein